MPIGGAEMRLISRHRNNRRRVPRISLSQEEIAADLHYPTDRRTDGKAAVARLPGRGR
jgi:hypothetical protein